MKIFYNPYNNKIMGFSDGENSMEFPYIETEEVYFTTENLVIVDDNDTKRIILTKA